MTDQTPEERAMCKARVHHTGMLLSTRCARYAKRAGFCLQHHPESQKKRDDKSKAKQEEYWANKHERAKREKAEHDNEIREAVEAETDRCAKIADEFFDAYTIHADNVTQSCGHRIAAAIRAEPEEVIDE